MASIQDLISKARSSKLGQAISNLGPSRNQGSIVSAPINAAKSFGQSFYNNTAPLGTALGYGLREAIYKPFGIADSQLFARQNQTNINAAQWARTPEAKQRLYNLVPNQMEQDAQYAQSLKREAPKAAFKTGLTLVGAGRPAQMTAGALLGGGLNAGIAGLQGQSMSKAFGQGAAQALPYTGVSRLTSPLWNATTAKIAGQASPLAQRGVNALVQAGGNIAENYITEPLFSGRLPTLQENIIAAGAGVGFGALSKPVIKAKSRLNPDALQTKPSVSKTLRQQVELLASDRNRNAGKYAGDDDLRVIAKYALKEYGYPENATRKQIKYINDLRFDLKNELDGDLVQDPKDPTHWLTEGMLKKRVAGFIDPSAKVGTDPLEALKTEARKYKSAEEFIQARIPEIKNNEVELVASTRGDTIEVDDLFIDKKGTGLGSKIVKELENYADANGKFLQINKAYNKSFWSRFGFEEIDANTLRREPRVLKYTKASETPLEMGSLKDYRRKVGVSEITSQPTPPTTGAFLKTKSQLADLYTQATAPTTPPAPTFTFKTDSSSLQEVKTPGGKTIKIATTPTLTTENVPLTTRQAVQTGGKATIPTQPASPSLRSKQSTKINTKQTKSSGGVLHYLKSKLYPTSVLPKEIDQAAKKWDADIKVSQVRANPINQTFKKIAQNSKLSENDQWELIKYAEIKDPVAAQQYAKDKGIEELVQRGSALIEQYRSFNDELYRRANLMGFDTNYIENHILHKYKETPEQIQAILDGLPLEEAEKLTGAGLGQRPGFSKKRTIDSYQMAEALGVSPRYRTFGQIAAEMEHQLQKAQANRTFMEALDNNGVISPFNAAPSGFVPLKATGVPKLPDGTPYAASPEVAPFLETVFGGQEAIKGLKWAGDLSSTAQDLSLVSPGYTVNAFTIGQAVKDITGGIGDIATLKPRQGFAKMAGTLRAFVPERNFDFNHRASIEAMARNNIGYSGSNNFQGDQSNFVKKNWNKVFNDPTFQKFMNERRVRLFENFLESTGDEKLAADMLKMYDGVTFDLGRDKNAESALKTFLFAPKYREAVIGTFANIAKGYTTQIGNSAYQSSRSLGAGMLLTYFALNALNQKLNDGKNMWENPPGKEMELVIPKTAFDPNASTDEYWSIPYMPGFMATPRRLMGGTFSLAKGDTNEAINQYSGLAAKPISAFGQAVTNKDYFGREIVNEDSAVPDLAQRAGYVGSQLFTPGFVREPMKYAQGKQSALTTALRTMELPLKEGKFSNKFWDDYNKGKKVQERLDELKYKDPTRALQFYQENREQIDNFQMMKPTAKQYGIDKEAGKVSTAPADYLAGLVPKAQASDAVNKPKLQDPEVIEMRISLKDPSLTGEEIAHYYLRDVTTQKTGSKYQDSKNDKKLWSRLSDIENRDVLTDEQKKQATAAMLEQAGISQKDYDYYQVAKEDNDSKTMYAYDQLETSGSFDDFMKFLVNGRRPYRSEILVADGVIDNLVDDGIIPYELGKDLKNIDLDERGQLKSKKGKARGASTKAAKAKLKAIVDLGENLKKIKSTSPKIKTSVSNNMKINTKAFTFSGA